MLYATGMTAADMHKAQIGIASVWWEGNPCNMHLLDLAGHVKAGVTEAGLQGMRFNTIGVSDAISMGTGSSAPSICTPLPLSTCPADAAWRHAGVEA
jgi:dihydroxy-acid dehydratase